jgi:hypothetical protein
LAVAGLLTLETFSIAWSTIWEWKNPKTYLDDAKVVASIVRPDDWIVLEFDPVSSYFDAMFLTHRDRMMSMPMLKKEEARRWLVNADASAEWHTTI